MSVTPNTRRLAAVVAADIVGYSTMMSKDEAAALKYREEIKTIITTKYAERSGRLFSLAGDGFLAEFGSPVEAVKAAYEVQSEIAHRHRTDASHPCLRIGVHLADVVVDGEDLLGDGVNIAARIESVGQPGTVTLSQQVLDHVKRAARLSFRDLGSKELKNLAEPVRLYEVTGELGLHSYAASEQPVVQRKSTAEDTRPSLVVLPFTSLGGDSEQEYLVNGISEDLVTELARFRAIRVLSRNMTLSLRGAQADVAALGRELGVGYSLGGSVRKQAGRVRIAVQLSRPATGETIWAEKFDGELNDVLDIQDRISTRVSATVIGNLEADLTLAAKRKQPSDLVAYDCLLRGLEHHRVGGATRDDANQAVVWFNRAIELDSDYGRAYAWRACALAILKEWTGEQELFDACVRDAKTGLMLDPNEAEVHRIMGSICLLADQPEKALGHFMRGLELNPSHAYVVAKTAEVYNYIGEPEKALEQVARAIAIDPFLPEGCRQESIKAKYLLGKNHEVLSEVVSLANLSRIALAYAVASAARLGEKLACQGLIDQLTKLDPEISVAQICRSSISRDSAVRAGFETELLGAGLPP